MLACAWGLAPAKLNLSLRVRDRRADGYHALDSIFVPVAIFDRLRVGMRPAQTSEVTCSVSGADVPADSGNLAVRAADLFLRRTGLSARITIELWKHIPVGAGLGGGSSDAAAVLAALWRLLEQPVAVDVLHDWALMLGADVPFFLNPRPARVRGIGEIVEPLGHVPPGHLVVAFPGFGLATRDVYRVYDEALTRKSFAGTERDSVNSGELAGEPPLLSNDLEPAALLIRPDLRRLKWRLRALGATQALMTGSGSAFFGVWADELRARAAVAMLRQENVWARYAPVITGGPFLEIERE